MKKLLFLYFLILLLDTQGAVVSAGALSLTHCQGGDSDIFGLITALPLATGSMVYSTSDEEVLASGIFISSWTEETRESVSTIPVPDSKITLWNANAADLRSLVYFQTDNVDRNFLLSARGSQVLDFQNTNDTSWGIVPPLSTRPISSISHAFIQSDRDNTEIVTQF
ncbi:MAG: hypothetical protein AB8F74_03575 [Saprospiraceae bacterium]